MSLNAAVSDAAAKTVSSPLVAAGAAVGLGAAGVAPPQAVSTAMSSIRTISQRERFIQPSLSSEYAIHPKARNTRRTSANCANAREYHLFAQIGENEANLA